MKFRKAIRQMLKGKAVRRPHWSPGTAINLGPNGFRWVSNGDAMTVHAYGQQATDWEVVDDTPPNPHTVGTWAWAREEAKRGRVVTCIGSAGGLFTKEDTYNTSSFENAMFIVDEITATDWRHA